MPPLPTMGGRRSPRRMLTPEEKANMPKISKALLLRIFSYLKPYIFRLIIVFLAIIISSVLGVLPSMLTGKMIDDGLYKGDFTKLVTLILISFFLLILSNLISVVETYVNSYISQHIMYDMKNQMYAHLQKMPQQFFTSNRQGDIITRMTSDINGVQSVISGTMSSIISNVCTIVVTLTALIEKNWLLALVGASLVPLLSVPSAIVGKKRWKMARESQEQTDKMNQILNETLSVSGQMLTKIFTREKTEYEQYKSVNKECTRLAIKERMAGMWFWRAMNMLMGMGPLFIYLVGGGIMLKFGSDSLTVGDITVIVSLLTRLYKPVDQMLNVQVDVVRSMALFTRIFEYFDMPVDIESPEKAVIPDSTSGKVEFKNVYFSYNASKSVLCGIDFVLEPGKTVALVGASGEGKSTIASLVPRLYDVTDGKVMFDGIDVRELDLTYLRSHIAMVTQESYLFNSTVRENLLYAKEDATDAEIESACRDANIHDFIMALPEGYDTLVGNRGFKLSGGEKQRISIARAILKNPALLILDEATSSLDSISEYAIQTAIEPLLKSRTSLVIAHRLSTIMSADEILVINDGKIVERGKHSELVNNTNGYYKKLYDTQFRTELKKETD